MLQEYSVKMIYLFLIFIRMNEMKFPDRQLNV